MWLCSWRGLSYCTYVPFLFWLFGGVCIKETVVWGVIYLGWKPQLHNSRHSISQRSIAHATQSFTKPLEPQLTQLFGLCIVQLLAGIFPCRGSGNRNLVARTAAFTYSASSFSRGICICTQYHVLGSLGFSCTQKYYFVTYFMIYVY